VARVQLVLLTKALYVPAENNKTIKIYCGCCCCCCCGCGCGCGCGNRRMITTLS
jgi:hypothetical protein